jgi:hypothetical protein
LKYSGEYTTQNKNIFFKMFGTNRVLRGLYKIKDVMESYEQLTQQDSSSYFKIFER